MAEKLRYVTFDTNVGWIGILGGDKGLLGTTLPQKTVPKVIEMLGNRVKEATLDMSYFAELVNRFRDYFNGRRVDFPDRLDLRSAPPFFNRVWAAARRVPFGETRTYAWLAEQAGNIAAPRAAGQAMARNPWPIIVPCHRILTSAGRLGGFGGGLALKQYLLNLEATADIR